MFAALSIGVPGFILGWLPAIVAALFATFLWGICWSVAAALMRRAVSLWRRG